MKHFPKIVYKLINNSNIKSLPKIVFKFLKS